jgi:hypothetical protein
MRRLTQKSALPAAPSLIGGGESRRAREEIAA